MYDNYFKKSGGFLEEFLFILGQINLNNQRVRVDQINISNSFLSAWDCQPSMKVTVDKLFGSGELSGLCHPLLVAPHLVSLVSIPEAHNQCSSS